MTFSNILVVDDEDGIREQLTRWLKHEGYRTEQAAFGNDALQLIRKSNFHVMLLDLKLPDIKGFDLLRTVHEEFPDICVIVLTAYGKDESPAEARRAGAFDFFTKPINFEALSDRIEAALEQFRAQRQYIHQQQEEAQYFQFENVLGKSRAIREMFETVKKIAATEETVLLMGETGTGKNLVAGAIHYNSRRKKERLIIADCTLLPDGLAQSELFGHEKGAFTGAHMRKIGRIELADRTTLFIDEVGELSGAVQAKLLRFLQEKMIERLGGLEPIDVDARIIAGTNRDLPAEVEAKTFREDLYHRLNRIAIRVPPLRERHGDIPLLVEHFIKVYNRRNARIVDGITDAGLDLLETYSFPGNVRELENIIARALLMESSSRITADTIRPYLKTTVNAGGASYRGMPLREARALFEKAYYSQILDEAKGNITHAAKIAEVDRSHFRNKLKDLGLWNHRRPK